jgi:hypothetical protein
LFNGPRGFGRVGLPINLAAAVSVASAVPGGAGHYGADEVLRAAHVSFAKPDPFAQGPFRFFAGYGSAKPIRTTETAAGAHDALLLAQASAPPSPGVPPPDFHVPQGRGRLGVLEPPTQFLHWTDYLEIVLPPADVVRRCQTAGAMGAPGTRIHGCSYRVAGRCLIIRVDDPGVARHELAHCNGWKHPGP